jgi:hypothetical protein
LTQDSSLHATLRAIALLLIFFVPLGGFAESNFARVDELASKRIPLKLKKDPVVLALYLGSLGKNDAERVRSIAVYLMNNFKYDHRIIKGIKGDYNARTLLKKKSIVCRHYAYLFKFLCNEIGLECEVVTGYVPNGYIPNSAWIKRSFRWATHAWNAVKVNGKWELVDLTWADAAHTDTENPAMKRRKATVKIVDERYYMPDPKDLLRDHLPVNPMWQLVENPISKKTFRFHKRKRFEQAPQFDSQYAFNDTIDKYYGLDKSARFLELSLDAYRFSQVPGAQLAQLYIDAGDEILADIPRYLRTKSTYGEAKKMYRSATRYRGNHYVDFIAKHKMMLCDLGVARLDRLGRK